MTVHCFRASGIELPPPHQTLAIKYIYRLFIDRKLPQEIEAVNMFIDPARRRS
jgi:hypothetical protein